LEAFKLVPMEDKKKIFGELDKDAKNIEAFKLIPENDRWLAFRYFEDNQSEAAELVPEKDKKFIFFNSTEEEAFNIFKEEGIKHKLYKEIFLNLPFKTKKFFNLLPLEDRLWAFKYLDDRSIETFKFIPEKERYKVFKYVDNPNEEAISLLEDEYQRGEIYRKIFQKQKNKDLEDFKKIPPEYRIYVFQLMDKKDIEAFKLFPEKKKQYYFQYLGNKNIEAFKLFS